MLLGRLEHLPGTMAVVAVVPQPWMGTLGVAALGVLRGLRRGEQACGRGLEWRRAREGE